jgi:hypothetical protein
MKTANFAFPDSLNYLLYTSSLYYIPGSFSFT